ncbi:MAG: hypothetical protein KAX05_12040, partial [Bacteroidales bacterium]|nr:hypothetical protein [Bacteroidales bacterium]
MRPICAFQMSDFIDERLMNNRLTIYETWRSALAKRKIPLLARRGVPSVSEGRGGCLTDNQPPPPPFGRVL